MQKVLRINLQAQNQATKAFRKKTLKKAKLQWQEAHKQKVVANQKTREIVTTERKNRREDWILGPLAPDRNTSTKKGYYGALHPAFQRLPDVPKQIGKPNPVRQEYTVEGNAGNIMVGDRVCVVSDRDCRGQIGTVKDISTQRREVKIKGINLGDIALPEWSEGAERKQRIVSQELPMSLDEVRLVAQVVDDTTGESMDVIVRHLRGGAPFYDREHGSNIPSHTRYSAGDELEIPWPEGQIRDFDRGDFDTGRQLVDTRTYLPSVIDQALPAGVIDELRPRISHRRTTHDEAWVTRKVIEDARSAWWQQRKLLTPKQEYLELRDKERLRIMEEARLQGPDPDTIELLQRARSSD